MLSNALSYCELFRSRLKRKGSGAKHLLSDTSNSTLPPRSRVDTESTTKILHWKFGVAPLVLRVSPVGVPLSTPFLPALTTKLSVKQLPGERGMRYVPVIWLDDLSITRNQYIELSSNLSHPDPKITLKVTTTNLLHFGIKTGLRQAFDQMSGLMSQDDIDEFRWWISDDRIYRFVLTQIISYVHLILEYLAFKDDWKFFSGRKSFSGISMSSLLFAQIRSVIIFLYLADSDTSYIVLVSIGKDVIYNLWKIFRIMKVQVQFNMGSLLPVLKYEDRSSSVSEEERQTAKYDSYAIQHMSLCLFPAIIGLAVYSLVYHTYRSWYSWLISSLADSVYFFGFISMTPQLYINYKLKSVAHLPIKVMLCHFRVDTYFF